jgi:hypothetical protein
MTYRHRRLGYLHRVPSTSKTIPFSTGLLSPLTFFSGFKGANRRGRVARAIAIDRVAAKHNVCLEGDRIGLLVRILRYDDAEVVKLFIS